MIRAATHIHTRHSYDSLTNPRRLVKALAARGVAMALIADHDSFAGSLETREIARELGTGLLAPVAAEICTDRGDVIVALDAPPAMDVAELKDWARLVPLVRARGGLIWLPHPFYHHRDVSEMAPAADVIEVFNRRCSPSENAQARDLCERCGKTPAYGADAHFMFECFAVRAEYPDGSGVLETLRHAPLCHDQKCAPRWQTSASQLVKALKARNVRNVLLNCAVLGLDLALHRYRK